MLKPSRPTSLIVQNNWQRAAKDWIISEAFRIGQLGQIDNPQNWMQYWIHFQTLITIEALRFAELPINEEQYSVPQPCLSVLPSLISRPV